MKKQWNRLLVAAISSSSVFVVSWYWYRWSDHNTSNKTNEQPVAFVGKTVEDIQRRPTARLLWQIVNTGEPLYNGEAIRTSERGEVRIQFADSDSYLDLEPDSLIVIKKAQGEIALDLLEGSLFVKSETSSRENKTGLVLNSANGKVDLSQASAALSVEKGKGVDVQLVSGKASLKGGNGQQQELKSKADIRVISPELNKPIYINAEAPEPTLFQWEGTSKGGHISLWLGENRKSLKEFSVAATQKSNLSATLPFGKIYWKIIETDSLGKTIKESSLFRSEVLPRYAPTMIFPLSASEIPAPTLPFSLTFKWQQEDDAEKVELEVATDAKLKNKILSKSFSKAESYTLDGLNKGPYYFRLSSIFKGSEKAIHGKIQNFIIKPQDSTLAANKAFIPTKVNFDISDAEHTQYFLDQPKISLAWKAEDEKSVAFWRLSLKDESGDPSSAITREIKETKLSLPINKPGRYIASIEAINKDKQVIGSSTSKTLVISPLPLINAPVISPGEGSIAASKDGKLMLEWAPVDGAKEYWLSLFRNGKELKKTKTTDNTTTLSNLLPGKYEVQLMAVDSHGRNSMEGQIRTVEVPERSNVKAPTLKKIKVQ